jgi:hypothetical protein
MANPDLGDPATLRQLLISRGVPADADDEALLAAARSAKHKLHITVLSARESTGQSLSPEQKAELEAYRQRLERYRAAWTIVAGAAPHAQVVKGWTIGDHYPPGLLRSAGDLDVVCRPDELWAAARALIDRGWELEALTLFPAGGRSRPSGDASSWCQIALVVTRPGDCDLIDEPLDVELRTADVATSIRVPAWRHSGASMPPAAANVLALAAERWERPFRTRDIYDLAILADQLDPAGLEALDGALTATMLWPQLRELARLLRHSSLATAPDQRGGGRATWPYLPGGGRATGPDQRGGGRAAGPDQPGGGRATWPYLPGGRRAAWRSRSARLRHSTALWLHPLRVAGLAAISTTDADRGAMADRLAQAVQRRIGSWRLLRLGLPLFAVPLPSGSRPETDGLELGLELERRGPHLVARTPIGSFLMVAGSCPQAWLDEASGAK